MFDLQRKNLVYKAIQLEKVFPIKAIKILNTIFILLALVFFLGFLKTGFLGLYSQQNFALFIILVCFFVITVIYLSFVDSLRQKFLMNWDWIKIYLRKSLKPKSKKRAITV